MSTIHPSARKSTTNASRTAAVLGACGLPAPLAVRMLASRYQLSLQHAAVIASLAGIGGVLERGR